MSLEELAEIEARLNHGGDDWTPREIEMKADIAALLAEVRRLTPAPKVAKFKRYPSGFSVLTVDGCAVGASISATASGVWQAWADRQFENFDSEPEARAHIEAWARGKGWEVRDA